MATVDTYNTVGVKEDVSDIISNISPTKTPFQSMIGTADRVTQRIFEWQEDSLMEVGSNAAAEGAPAPEANAQPTVMRQNTTQIFTKTASVTGSMEATKSYGRGKEMSYQMAMRAKELKRDLEWAYVGSGQSFTAGADKTARTMAGFQGMIDPSKVYTAGIGFNAGSKKSDATPLTEQMVLDAQQAGYAAGADLTTLMVVPSNSVRVASFSASGRTVFVENQATTLNNSISIYKSPYGTLKVVMNRFLRGTNANSKRRDPTSDALLFDADMWKKVPFRPWFTQDLAKVGDCQNKQIIGEHSLKHVNFNASVLITNLG